MIKRIFWNLVFIAAVIYGLYYFKVWPFKNNVAGFEYLRGKYCEQQDAPRKTAICDCIVRAAELDMKTRFKEAEYAAVQADRASSAYALQKSLTSIKPDAMRCLKQQGQDSAWDFFVTDLATLDNELLKKAKGILSSGADKIETLWQDKKAEKAAIDKKY